ncbi:purine and uridine phosphorylase, partial [Pyrenochaeta sp. DS3sAY3a]
DYTVGWVCALPIELAAAQEMLDEEHALLDKDPHDENIYSLGLVAGHNVVIVCLPAGRIGNNPAAAVATQMKTTFKGIRFGLMVGIGGGVPSAEADIRLGDVVVSKPVGTFGGIVQYDSGKATSSGFARTGSLNSPPQILLSAVVSVQAKEFRGKSKVAEHIAKLSRVPTFQRDKAGADVLFEATYDHEGTTTCSKCKTERQEEREPRGSDEEVVIHYGTIASGNQVIKNAAKRDDISADLDGVLCFEMEAAGLMNSFPCLVVRGICDYADSHKNKRWQPYAAGAAAAYAKEVLSAIPQSQVEAERKISEVIFDLHEVAEDHRNIARDGLAVSQQSLDIQLKARDQKLSDRQAKCLQLFRLTKDTEDATYEWYKERIADRVEGTCMWFLNHPHFQEWRRKESGPLLVSADPGCGKSVLAKYLIDQVLPESSTVCYFFFKDQVQNTVREALCAVLHQLFSQKPSLLVHAMEQQNKDGDGLVKSASLLWSILGDAVQDANAGSVTIVLDALDECAESETQDLMRLLVTQVRNSEIKNAKLKLLMTSRPYEHVVAKTYSLSEAFPYLRIPGEDESETISQEVNCVIKYRVDEFAEQKKLSDEIKACLKEQLLKMDHRTYLWVYLVFDHLENLRFKRTAKGMASTFSQLPKTVNQAYEQILNKSGDRSKVQKALAIILAATRPLTLLEMSIAMEVDENTKSFRDLDLEQEEDFKARLRSWCGLFVSVHHGRIYFLHQTAREFLLAELSFSKTIDKEMQWHGFTTMKDAHTALAECCVRFISLSDVGGSPTPDQTQNDKNNAFLEYSAKSWGLHLRESRICDDARAAIALLSFKLFDLDSEVYSMWSRIYWEHKFPRDPQFCTGLMVACFFGHIAVVRLLINKGANVNAQGGHYGSALQAASEEGHEQIVRLLINKGADVNAQCGYYGSALQAASQGHEQIVRLLIDKGADVNAQD